MPDEDYKKKHKVNTKKECRGNACMKERPRRTIKDIFDNTPSRPQPVPSSKPVKKSEPDPVKLVVGQPAVAGKPDVETQKNPVYSGEMTPAVSKKYGTSENIPAELKKKGVKVKHY